MTTPPPPSPLEEVKVPDYHNQLVECFETLPIIAADVRRNGDAFYALSDMMTGEPMPYVPDRIIHLLRVVFSDEKIEAETALVAECYLSSWHSLKALACQAVEMCEKLAEQAHLAQLDQEIKDHVSAHE